jgi:DNA repair protein RecO (recombination protein O)
MYHKSKGIVLQTVKYGETSAIAKIYTEQLGLLSFMVYGYRSSKSTKKAAMLQQGTLLEIDFIHQANKHIHQIKEIRRAHTYQSIPFDMRKSSVMLFLIELISRCVIENQINEEEFDFIYNQFLELDSSPEIDPFFHLHFMVSLTQYLGFFPENNASSVCKYFDVRNGLFTPTTPQTLNDFLKEESALLSDLLSNSNNLKTYSKEVRNRFLTKFLTYYAYHIDNFKEVKSLKIFEDIFA